MAESHATPIRPVNARTAPVVADLLASNQRVALSELTLVEARVNISKDWQIDGRQNAAYDEPWARDARR